MFLQALPLVFMLAGLVLYTVLAGADFGAGMWRLLAGGGQRGARIRDHAHHSMGPVWEANHVWLIFVLTVAWTAYPTFVGSAASTLAVPFFIAALGIIVRGASYALRSAASTGRELRIVDGAFAVASLVTPFALGTIAGAIAAGRVPVGNAAGQPLVELDGTGLDPHRGAWRSSSPPIWPRCTWPPTRSATATPSSAQAFRARALAAGVVAGALAVAGLVVLHADAHSLYTELLHGTALVVLIVSLVAGVAALVLVAVRRFEPARYVAALAVAAVIAAWAFARYPMLLPGLTVSQAAAPHDTLVAVVVAVVAGGAILFPSLGLLFSLLLRGRLGDQSGRAAGAAGASPVGPAPRSTPAAGPRRRGAAHRRRRLPQRRRRRLGARDRRVRSVRLHVAGFAAIVPRALAEDG